jgi:hypothetical protein
VFILSPKSCVNPWSDSGDRELDLGELTRGCYSSRELRSHLSDRCRLQLSFARVNVWVSSMLPRVAIVRVGSVWSSVGLFGRFGISWFEPV